jgi:hypothetical protein
VEAVVTRECCAPCLLGDLLKADRAVHLFRWCVRGWEGATLPAAFVFKFCFFHIISVCLTNRKKVGPLLWQPGGLQVPGEPLYL